MHARKIFVSRNKHNMYICNSVSKVSNYYKKVQFRNIYFGHNVSYHTALCCFIHKSKVSVDFSLRVLDPLRPSSVANPKCFVHKQRADSLRDKNAIIPGTDLVSY